MPVHIVQLPFSFDDDHQEPTRNDDVEKRVEESSALLEYGLAANITGYVINNRVITDYAFL